MNATAPSLSVWVGNNLVCIKIAGRASFTSSVDFKTLVNTLWLRGYSAFLLDLTNCLLMDSTFLGVLAGFGLRVHPNDTANHHGSIELLNPSPRIFDLLENLGVSHLFKVIKGPELTPEKLAPIQQTDTDRKELKRTCLEAHQTLMDINPENVPKFKDIAQFLSEDLKKLETAHA